MAEAKNHEAKAKDSHQSQRRTWHPHGHGQCHKFCPYSLGQGLLSLAHGVHYNNNNNNRIYIAPYASYRVTITFAEKGGEEEEEEEEEVNVSFFGLLVFYQDCSKRYFPETWMRYKPTANWLDNMICIWIWSHDYPISECLNREKIFSSFKALSDRTLRR